jgi:hypothetical protein
MCKLWHAAYVATRSRLELADPTLEKKNTEVAKAQALSFGMPQVQCGGVIYGDIRIYCPLKFSYLNMLFAHEVAIRLHMP